MTARIDAALPQTQCTRCGYPDCAAYAEAIANGSAGINQCPPGGAAGITRLAQITGHPVQALSSAHGAEAPRTVVFIDEDWCIGCTLCINACPTDAIVGANKRMHTVIEAYCTGCSLCIPVCPVDCIETEVASGSATGWDAWSAEQAHQARTRYASHKGRMGLRHAKALVGDPLPATSAFASTQGHGTEANNAMPEVRVAQASPLPSPATPGAAPSSSGAAMAAALPSAAPPPSADAARKAAIAAALARARQQRSSPPKASPKEA